MAAKNFGSAERRRYIRMDSVFPVQFRLLDESTDTFVSDWAQGFTNNIGKGGLCVSVNHLPLHILEDLSAGRMTVCLEISMPLRGPDTVARARIAWVKQVGPGKHLVGLSYAHIDAAQNDRIMRYANFKRIFVPGVIAVVGFLTLAVVLNAVLSAKLIRGNKALVEQLVKIVQESSIVK